MSNFTWLKNPAARLLSGLLIFAAASAPASAADLPRSPNVQVPRMALQADGSVAIRYRTNDSLRCTLAYHNLQGEDLGEDPLTLRASGSRLVVDSGYGGWDRGDGATLRCLGRVVASTGLGQ